MKNLFIVILITIAAAFGVAYFHLKAQSLQTQPLSAVTNAIESAANEIVLTRRMDNGAYRTSAYSFRLASQDLAVHHNYVDVVYDGDGRIYINPTGGMNSRIADLGTGPFGLPVATPPADANWQHGSIVPQVSHVYYQEVKDERQSFAVEFFVTQATPDLVKLRWQPVDPQHKILPLAPNTGMAGTMGISDNNEANGANGVGANADGGAGGNGGNGK